MLGCASADDEGSFANATGGETVDDGLRWYDVIIPLFVYENGVGEGSYLYVIGDYTGSDGRGDDQIAIIEFDDASDYVGAERGRIVEGDQQYIIQYNLLIKQNYFIKASKGNNISQKQFDAATYTATQGTEGEVYWNDGGGEFIFNFMSNYENIPIGAELAKLEIYDNRECTGEPLETFSLRL